jgi:predicted DNA-binding transcriptional regulator AlpA
VPSGRPDCFDGNFVCRKPPPKNDIKKPLQSPATRPPAGRVVMSLDRQPKAPAAKPGRTLPASIEPMLHIDDLAALLSCSRRLVERMRSAGKVPKPDIHVGKCPRWKPATIRAWIDSGGKL